MASYSCHMFSSLNKQLSLLSIPNSHKQFESQTSFLIEVHSTSTHWLKVEGLWNNIMYSRAWVYILKAIFRLPEVIHSIGILLNYF